MKSTVYRYPSDIKRAVWVKKKLSNDFFLVKKILLHSLSFLVVAEVQIFMQILAIKNIFPHMNIITAQKMKKSIMENFNFCALYISYFLLCSRCFISTFSN